MVHHYRLPGTIVPSHPKRMCGMFFHPPFSATERAPTDCAIPRHRNAAQPCVIIGARYSHAPANRRTLCGTQSSLSIAFALSIHKPHMNRLSNFSPTRIRGHVRHRKSRVQPTKPLGMRCVRWRTTCPDIGMSKRTQAPRTVA